jgi:hypothetical protein
MGKITYMQGNMIIRAFVIPYRFSTLKMEVAGCSKSFIFVYLTSRRHNPDDYNIDINRRENLYYVR